jgi:hypothetical protein
MDTDGRTQTGLSPGIVRGICSPANYCCLPSVVVTPASHGRDHSSENPDAGHSIAMIRRGGYEQA